MGDLLLEPSQYELLIESSLMTIRILVGAFVLGIVLSLIFGVARLSDVEWVRGAALVFVELARGSSSIILLFMAAYALPAILDIDQPPLQYAAIVALGINMGGYGAEIIRGAILSVPKGQNEASISLNLSPFQRLRHVVLPQAMTVILPPMGNLTIEILKGTALVSLIGVTDIMGMANNIRQQQLANASGSLPILYLNVLVLYFILSQVVSIAFRFLEWQNTKRFKGGPTLSADELPASIRSQQPGAGG
ncbi:amino acid ABC transporter permease [Nocardioides panacisoli]|uniref:amino acid ABC transporter permease n=1 Tax=Nocardioides panacisoli TaxID=627624 RepID=UPI001C636B9C|nr:amino acid ABC transporter permease [Nocardioides panacisoli]QYJ05319.1 amino acid ABC transporter permease [Nocardioides panacisoli]